MSNTKQRNRRFLFAILAAIASVATVVPIMMGLLVAPKLNQQNDQPITPTTTAPPLTIKPLPVRPVISAFVTTPEECP
ncbi:MAG: hypothetical protein ACR2JM_04050, partial [Mycobacterium sp.]